MSERPHIKTRRLSATRVYLYIEGAKIGEVVKYRARSYGLFLAGIYWRRGEPTRHGGFSGTGFSSLKGAIDSAGAALTLP
jgi:hypothetical protein